MVDVTTLVFCVLVIISSYGIVLDVGPNIVLIVVVDVVLAGVFA
jgi:hypothetical protein